MEFLLRGARAVDDPVADPLDPIALEIPRDLHDAMVAHCLREAPLECCGLLGGVASFVFVALAAPAAPAAPAACRGLPGGIVPRASSFHPLRNAAASETRYDADPHDVIDAVVALRRRGAEVLAIYHSHPRWEAIPSRTDLRDNHWGPVPRIIVSLLGEIPDVRVWRLDPDSYQDLPWRIVEPQAADTPMPEVASPPPSD
jgi:proteasome lid subunit RPN8/RPN11